MLLLKLRFIVVRFDEGVHIHYQVLERGSTHPLLILSQPFEFTVKAFCDEVYGPPMGAYNDPQCSFSTLSVMNLKHRPRAITKPDTCPPATLLDDIQIC